MLCCCEDISLQRYHQELFLEAGEYFDSVTWCFKAVTDIVCVTFSWGIPQHKGGTNIPSSPRGHKKLPLLWISAFSGGETLSWWCLTRCCWFSVLCQRHERLIRMRPQCWGGSPVVPAARYNLFFINTNPSAVELGWEATWNSRHFSGKLKNALRNYFIRKTITWEGMHH